MDKNNIELIVLDTIDNYAQYKETDIFTAILFRIDYFTDPVIENKYSFRSNLERILDNYPLKEELLTSSKIIHSVAIYDLLDLFIDYLLFRQRRSELFGQLNYMVWSYQNFEHIEKVILDEYWVLENPFMHGRDFFFRGVLWDDFLRNPSSFGLATDQILLEGIDRKKAYAKLNPSDHIILKGLSQVEDENWYLRGNLEFNLTLKTNIIYVHKIISKLLDRRRY